MIVTTQKEMEALREGGKRLALHMDELIKMVAPGITSMQLEEKALEMIERDGDEPAFLGHKERKGEKPYPSALCVSINDVIVHSPAAENGAVIKEGDIVCLDFGIKHQGYYTDHARTVIAGSTKDPEDVRMIQAAEEALAAGIAQARVGNWTGDIGHAVEEIARREKLGYPRNLSGHGVGLKVHEEPYVANFGAPKTGEKLVEGLVIAIEPMFTRGSGELFIDKDGYSYRTKDRSRTAHVEHTVIIMKNGPEILTAL